MGSAPRAPARAPLPVEKKPPPGSERFSDPDGLKRARERAASAKNRTGRFQLRIPLSTTNTGAGSGLQLT